MNQVLKSIQIGPNKKLTLVKGDITLEQVDAIVNAANSYLKHGGGVAGAIVRRGGRVIQEESDRIGYVPVGQAALTTGGNLPAKYVIHAVGPRWGEGDEDNKLKNAVENSLKLAEKHGLTTISMPAISSGIFGFPVDRCAKILLTTIREHLQNKPEGSLKEVRVCLFDNPAVSAFQKIFDEIFA